MNNSSIRLWIGRAAVTWGVMPQLGKSVFEETEITRIHFFSCGLGSLVTC